MNKKHSLLFLSALVCCLLIGACKKETVTEDITIGKLNKRVINSLTGIEDNLSSIITQNNMTYSEYILLTTDSAWALPDPTKSRLKDLRNSLDTPTVRTLLQKVIPLSNMKTYINNVYGGTIGGFVSMAADLKYVYTMKDVYKGLRLDYEGSLFDSTDIGYAVIRFYTDVPEKISIPYHTALGGSVENKWPFGGGGFTTSTLGKGGYPEWKFDGYYAPRDGAELYEINANGYEILRAVYDETNLWETVDAGMAPNTRSISSNSSSTQQYATYQGRSFFLRATIDGICHLTTMQNYPELHLEVVEKGIWGIKVAEELVTVE